MQLYADGGYQLRIRRLEGTPNYGPRQWATLGRKQTVKESWDAVKVLRIGDDRARDASAQRLRREFGAITIKEGETVSEFGIRISTLATNLRVLGDNIIDTEVVKKLL